MKSKIKHRPKRSHMCAYIWVKNSLLFFLFDLVFLMRRKKTKSINTWINASISIFFNVLHIGQKCICLLLLVW